MQELTCGPVAGRQALQGSFASPGHAPQVVARSCRVTRPDGSLLFVLLRRAMPRAAGQAMYQAVRGHITPNKLRGTASGQKAFCRVLKDGTRSAYSLAARAVDSTAMGYFDRSPRYPYCRRAWFAQGREEVFARCLPAVAAADRCFAAHAPEQYQRQRQVVARTHPAYLIPGSSFTTITLNRNFRTAYHRDAGDLPEGFGVMTCYRRGLWSGAELVFPEYGVAAALDSLDVILFDPHALHGNLELRLLSPDAERVTCVHYFRKNMPYCAEPARELQLAAQHDRRRGGRDMRAGAWAPQAEGD